MRLIDADALKEAIKNDIYVVDYGVEGAIYGMFWSGIENAIDEQPTAELEWNNHTVACLLADMFDDSCACNYNDIDEWLPGKCEVIDSCPDPVGVACWEQFLTHRKER